MSCNRQLLRTIKVYFSPCFVGVCVNVCAQKVEQVDRLLKDESNE